MSEPGVVVEREGHLTIIRINREERLNAIDFATGQALGKAFEEFEKDHDQWVAILTGTGRAFCTGNDLRDMAAGANQGRRRPGSHGYGWASITKRFSLYKPVIAAINGFAVAGGLELALVCDILVASQSARLGLTEVRWALMPTGGGTQRLPRSVPRAWANYMIFTGEQISAQEAKEIGLVTHVVPDEQLMDEARKIAGTILKRGPLAVWAAKEAIIRGADLPLEQGLVLEDFLGGQVGQTADAKAGPRAFAARQEPVFNAE